MSKKTIDMRREKKENKPYKEYVTDAEREVFLSIIQVFILKLHPK